jgi:glycosyltransferase 2 family protein
LFSKYKKKILISVSLGAVVFLLISLYADFDKIISAFGKFKWLWLPLILSLSILNYFFRFFKWHYYLKILKIKLPLLKSILIFFSSFVMSVTPGKMGELLKSFLLKEDSGEPVSKTAPILFAERLTDFLSIVILCLVGAVYFDYGRNVIILSGIVFISILLILSYKKLSVKIIDLLGKISFLKKHLEKLHTAYESIYNLIKFKHLIVALLISVVSWFFECMGFYIVVNVFSSSMNSPEISILTATFIYAFSTLIGAVAMLPGGLGLTEASLAGLLILLKIPKDISAASTIIIRIATLWFAVLIGIISLYIYQRITHKSIENIENNALAK